MNYLFLRWRNLLKNKFAKEIFWSFSTKGITILLFLLLNIYLARTLGTEGFGAWSFFFSAFTIIFVLSYLGLNASAKKYVAQYNKEPELTDVLRSSVKLRFILSLLFAILIFLFRHPLALLFGKPEFASFFMFAAPLILFAGLVEFLKQVFMGLYRLKYNFIINFCDYTLRLFLVIVFFSFSKKIVNIVNSFTGAAFVTSLVGFYYLYKNFYYRGYSDKKIDFKKKIFRYSVPLFIINIGFLLATEIDTLMLGLLSIDKEVGIYAVAKQIIVKLPHISLAIAMGTMPVFAKLGKENKVRLKNLFSNLLKVNALIFLPIAAVIFSSAGFLIPLIFGIDYKASVLPLRILTLYLICVSFLIFFNSFLDYQGLAKKRAINFSFTIFLNIVLNLLLIPRYGAIGASWATVVSYLPYFAFNGFEVRKRLKNI